MQFICLATCAKVVFRTCYTKSRASLGSETLELEVESIYPIFSAPPLQAADPPH